MSTLRKELFNGAYVQVRSVTSSVEKSSRTRAPSATLALVLVGQIQFLAALSLVDSEGSEHSEEAVTSWILDFAKHLRSEDA